MAPFDAARPVPHVQSLAPGPDGIGAIDYADEPQLDFWSGLPSRLRHLQAIGP
jgi:hypothetical protein